MEILKNSVKNIKKIDQDKYINIDLKVNTKHVVPGHAQEVVDLAQLADDERQTSMSFNLIGNINYISLLNRVGNTQDQHENKPYPNTYSMAENLFNPINTNRTFKKSFDIYLVKTSGTHIRYIPSGNNKSIPTTDIEKGDEYKDFIRMYEVIENNNTFRIYPNAFSKNIFREQQYGFLLNRTIDLKGEVDFFGSPYQKIFLYLKYKPVAGETFTRTLHLPSEEIPSGVESGTLSKGDLIYGDRVDYHDSYFKESITSEQIYTITTLPLGTDNLRLKFIYNPFIPIRIGNYETTVQKIPVTDEIIRIPWYAKENNGYYYFQNRVDYGEENLDTGLNLDPPFINGSHVIHENINLFIKPDLSDPDTNYFFEDLKSRYRSDGFVKDFNSIIPKC